jgi:hypothetical protein
LTGRVHVARGGHQHLAWESQPLVGPSAPPRRYSLRALVLVAVVAFMLGLCF